MNAFQNIMKNFREKRWESSELNGGKFSEVVYSILSGHVSGTFPPRPSKPSNFPNACRNLEQADATRFSRSVRIQIPRMLIALYEIRNNRGVGHVAGDVDPNHMDALGVVSMSKWVLAELVRVFHATDTTTATAIVESLLDRTTPIVWEVNGKRRILDSTLGFKDQTLLLLYSRPGPISENDLVEWLEHSNASVYRRDILRRVHKQRLIDYDEASKTVCISPLGVTYVEDNLPLEV